MVVSLSDGEVSDHEFGSDENGNFFAFTATTVVNESVLTYKKLMTNYARLLQRMQ